jgi:F-type H+-transporting ATPase subunit b
MRAKVGLAAAALAVIGWMGVATPAFAQTETSTTVKLKEANKECIEKLEKGQEIDDCQQAPNPILPATNELIWGSISFVLLLFLLQRFAYPAIRKGMEARSERIRSSLDEADQAKADAESILGEYQAKLADARNESTRIIEEARQAADQLRQDLRRQAEAEVTASKQRAAQEEIDAAVERATADLRVRVRDLTLELAEKVVQRNLDRESNLALIDQFIDELGTTARG